MTGWYGIGVLCVGVVWDRSAVCRGGMGSECCVTGWYGIGVLCVGVVWDRSAV